MNVQDRIKRLREGGHVQRAHGIPHFGSYDVAAHTWHIGTLLFLLHPNPSLNLVKAVHFHDIAERWVGDIPAIAKWASPTLKAESDRLEDQILGALGVYTALDPEEMQWLRALDLLELFLWCIDQGYMGNGNTNNVIDNIRGWFQEHQRELPVPVYEFWSTFRPEGRTSDREFPGG